MSRGSGVLTNPCKKRAVGTFFVSLARIKGCEFDQFSLRPYFIFNSVLNYFTGDNNETC